MNKILILALFLGLNLLHAEGTPYSEFDLSSPQKTMRAFFQSMKEWNQEGNEQVHELFEIHEEDIDKKKSEGRFYAQLLKDILDRTQRISYDTIPSDSSLGVYTVYNSADGQIKLRKDKYGQYKFSESTTLNLDEIYQGVIHLPAMADVIKYDKDLALRLRQQLLKYPILSNSTLYVKNWQWIVLMPLLIIAVIIYGLGSLFTKKLLAFFFKENPYISTLPVGKPLGLLLGSFMFYNALQSLMLYNDNFFFNTLTVTFHIISLASVIWFLWQASNGALHIFELKAQKTESKFDDLLVPMFRTASRLVLFLLAIFMGAKILKYDVSHLIAGLGIGSLAVALAAKDTIENLFGSVTVVLDRPFQIGDWVVIDDKEGSVEKLGFRSTRIRTFYDSVITVPNSKLISAVVDNMGKRKYRRIKTTLGITYQSSPDQIEAFCEGVRELIRTHPYTRKDYYHVYLNNFGASSLDVMLYCFVEVPDWAVELREKERLFLDIMRLAQELNVEFAYPTQTLFMQKGELPEQKDLPSSVNDLAKGLSNNHFIDNQKPGGVKY